MRFLLDTCVVSDFARGDRPTLAHLCEISPREVAVSTITEMEIAYGLKLNPRLARRLRPIMDEFLGAITILPYSREAAAATSELRAVLRRKGTPIGAYDALIAGTALAQDLTLVTSNSREFQRVDQIRVEDWRR